MLEIQNNDLHTRFEKHILTNGKCQLIIVQNESLNWLFNVVFDKEKEADEFLNDNWQRYCRISEKIYYAGVFAMERAYRDFKDGYFY